MVKIVSGFFILAFSLSAWQKDGLPITSEPGNQKNPKLIVPQGKDYFYVVWEDYNRFPFRVVTGKFDATTGKPLWSSPLVVVDSGGHQSMPQAVSTPSGGFILVFQIDTLATKRTIFATKIGSDKTWQWASKWVRVSSVEGVTYNPLLSLDGSGEGCYVTWGKWDENLGIQDVQAAHISSEGEVTFKKTLTRNTSGGWFPAIVPSLGGDAIVLWKGKWPGDDSSSIFGQRLSPMGEFKWDTLGVLINRIGCFECYWGMIENNSGGGIAFFIPPGDYGMTAQLISPQGDIKWQKDGVKVATTAFMDTAVIRFDTDGCSGCILSYPFNPNIISQYPNQLIACRYDSTGDSIWSSEVFSLPNPADSGWGGINSMANSAPGECIVAWHGDTTAAFYAARVDASGKVRWTVPICSFLRGAYIEDMAVVADLKGGAYVIWQDDRNGWDNIDIFAQHIDSTGAMGIGETTGRKQTLHEGLLSIEPNPFSQTTKISSQELGVSSEGVILKIYDVAGKLVKSFYLTPHSSLLTTGIIWDGRADTGEPTPPGVYFCRLETKNYQVTKKVIRIK
jgi:hypothetical protein